MPQVKCTVLIVNDSQQERANYRGYLQQETSFDYTVWEAESGEEALRLCVGAACDEATNRQLPDAILLDYSLPDRDGIAVLEALKTDIGSNCPPAIMLNDRGLEAIAIRAFKTGVEDYLIKSEITPESLRYITRTAIENFRLRQKLRESEERFRISIDNMLDCFGIFTAIRERNSGAIVDFQIDYLNAAALKSNKLTGESIGRRLGEVLPMQRECGLLPEYCRVVETGEPFVKECVVYGDRASNPNPTKVYSVQVSKLDDGFVAAWRDITEQKRSEIALRQSEERYRAIVEDQSELICRFAPDCTLTFVNEAYSRYFGSTPEQLIGQSFLNLISESDLAAVQRQIAELRAATPKTPPITHEHPVLKPNGEIGWQEWANRAIFDEDGRLVEFQSVGRDITARHRMQAELKESQVRLNLALQSAQTGFWDLNLITKEAIWSVQCKQLLGLPDDWQETNYSVLRAHLHPDDRLLLDRAIEVSLECGCYETEFRVVWDDGSIHWLADRGQVFYSETGQAVRMVGLCTDITDRKAAELALQQSNDRFELAAAAANCLIYDYDLERNTVARSSGLTNLLGYSLSEVEAPSEWWYERIHPSQRESILEAKRTAVLGTENAFCLEYQVRHRDGHYLWVQDRGFIVRDESDRAVRIVGSTIDISERHSIEQRLQDSREQLQLGVKVAGVGLARFNYASNTVELAPEAAALYGLDELTVTRDRVHSTFHPEEREMMERIIQQVLDPAGDGWFEREHRVVWPDGEARWLYVRKQVFFEGTGDSARPSYAILAAIDVTERAQLLAETQAARAAAEAANRSKDDFIAVVAHELRSPLNAVVGWAQLLRKQKADAAVIDRAVEAIERGTQAQLQLIEDLPHH